MNAKEYAMAHSQLVTVKDLDGKLHSKLTALCQQYEQNRQETEHRLKMQQAIKQWGVVLGILLLLVAAGMFLLMLSRKHNRRLQNEKDDVGQLLESERQTHKIQQAALSGRLKQSNESLRDVSQQLESIKASMNVETDRLETQLDFSAFMDSPVCKLIMERVNKGNFKSKIDYAYYKDYALDKEDLTALHTAVDRHFGRFTTRLKKAYPSLTKTDLDYCCLYLLGLTDADVAALMQRAYNTVNERNSKLRRIFGSENPISATLRAIANEFTID